jgi:hypothetical protein
MAAKTRTKSGSRPGLPLELMGLPQEALCLRDQGPGSWRLGFELGL